VVKGDTDRVFDDFREALSSEQLSDALRSIKEHLEKVKSANVKAN
jgi:hypothetical protein